MQFQQIVILDQVLLTEQTITKLQSLSPHQIIHYTTNSQDKKETITRIANAEAIFIGLNTIIDQEIIDACTSLQAIFICGTNSKKIDLNACAKKNIIVNNIRDYSEEGVVEWILYELITLRRGRGPYQWRDTPAELSNKIIGIIGMGAVGKLLAQTMLNLNMNVLYYSKTRKKDIDTLGAIFTNKKDLLDKSDIISLQTPRDVIILEKEDFALMKSKVLINNTLDKAFDETDFYERIALPNNYLIQDACPEFSNKFQDIDRVITRPFIAGQTKEFIERLNNKVFANVEAYLAGTPNHLYAN